MLQHLLEVALLGTEKKILDPENLPVEIREYIHDRHTGDPELKFLEAAALVHYYMDAGKMPVRFSGTWNEEIIEETKQIAPPDLLNIFSKLESVDYQWKESLIILWLNVLIDRSNIVNPELVTKLLSTGKNFSQTTKSKIVNVTGNKGAWVLSYADDLNYKQPILNDNVWLEGSLQERKNLLSTLRKNNPVQSIETLRSTWADESVVTKRSFLEMIQETSTDSDLPFLVELYEGEFKFQPKEKKTEKECRRVLVSILLKYKDTSLYQTTTSQLSKYFAKSKKGILGSVTGKESVSYSLPETEDEFWNNKTMEQVYGFETKNIDIAIYNFPSQYWLSLFIEFISIDFWVQPFDHDYKRMLDCFLEAEKFKTTVGGKTLTILQEAFLQNTKTHHNNLLANAMAQKLTTMEVIPLLTLMTEHDYESFVQKNNYFGDTEVLMNGPFDQDHFWSLSFSKAVIQKAYELATQNAAAPALGHIMARHIHKHAGDDLIKYHEKARETNAYNLWNKNIFEPVFMSMEIRTLIDDYKK